jgi:CRP-like cAMP-binding protein
MKEFSFDQFLTKLDSYEELKCGSLRKVCKKGEHVFIQGECCKDVFCMHRGLLKLYYNTLEGKEWIKSFIPDKGIVGSRHSQMLNAPSTFSVLCLEDSEMTVYPYDLFQKVCVNDRELAGMLFGFTQWLGLKKELREYRLLCLPVEEAYTAGGIHVILFSTRAIG